MELLITAHRRAECTHEEKLDHKNVIKPIVPLDVTICMKKDILE
ncbi:hypothetical protein QUF81_00100 [Peribacillus simplex]|nr:hypothetical protein [Peribacillus simplex]MDM5291704.1 hypothetical protein [Peribacillus simplex]